MFAEIVIECYTISVVNTYDYFYLRKRVTKMAVNNFYIQAQADGRASKTGIGPKAKDGGSYVEILQREEGEITTAFTIKSFAKDLGTHIELTSVVFNSEGHKIAEHVTTR